MRKIHSVLYVDDDPDICEVVKTTLTVMARLSVSTAASGEEAIARARTDRPDLVLMDIMMPGLDGPSTLTRMRGDALLSHIPVIFMTAKLLPAEVAHFLQLGAIGVIGKPFDPLKLSDELFLLWRQAGAPRSPAITGGSSPQDEVQTKILSLSDAFLARTNSDVFRLLEMIESARQGDEFALQEVRQLAHKIRGSGAVFGFPKVSAVAATIERLAVTADTIPPGSNYETAVLPQLSHCVGQLGLTLKSVQNAGADDLESLSSAGRG